MAKLSCLNQHGWTRGRKALSWDHASYTDIPSHNYFLWWRRQVCVAPPQNTLLVFFLFNLVL